MKRFFYLLVSWALFSAPVVRAQDAATQERLDKLTGLIEDLAARQEALKNQMAELNRELQSVREQSSRPNTSYARQEDLHQLRGEVREVDRKRIEDAEKVKTELMKLRKVLETLLSLPKTKTSSQAKDKPAPDKPAGDEKVFPYTIQSGDRLEAIALAYREKNIKVTVAQIIAANPGLKADRLRPGQKIVIPAPQP